MGYWKPKGRRADDSKLWEVFSLYIRLRDADEHGLCKCISCGKLFPWGAVDAGHFISRSKINTKYNEKNVHSQCKADNRFGEGYQYAQGKEIDKRYGAGTADLLVSLSRIKKTYSKFEIDTLTKYFREEIKKLKKQKGL